MCILSLLSFSAKPARHHDDVPCTRHFLRGEGIRSDGSEMRQDHRLRYGEEGEFACGGYKIYLTSDWFVITNEA